jgi:hypothetical protein
MTPLIPVICALTVFFGASSATAAAMRPSANVFGWDKIQYMYAFGDSYTFVQGTAGHANFRCAFKYSWYISARGRKNSFIGDALDFSFTPNELLSNEIIPRNVSTTFALFFLHPFNVSRQARKDPTGYMNVEVYQDQLANFLRLSEIEFLTGCLGGSPLRCKKQLWNFAFAGSDIDSALSVSPHFPPPNPISIISQSPSSSQLHNTPCRPGSYSTRPSSYLT